MTGKRQSPIPAPRRCAQLVHLKARTSRRIAQQRGRTTVARGRPVDAVTDIESTGEHEPRRSVRTTKGQPTKPFDEIEPPAAPKRRQTKKSKKAREQEQEQEQELEQEEGPEDELIRCVCGATEQDEDSGEAWIACETCGAWQHNVCVDVSSFEDEIPEFYWCEQCRPQNHKELLASIARGEKLWEARRKKHEEKVRELEEEEKEEEKESKKKKKGGKKGKGKRASESKEELEKPADSKAKPSPAPEPVKDMKEPAAKQGKRKTREESNDTDGKVRRNIFQNSWGIHANQSYQSAKLRRVSENEAVPVVPVVPVVPTVPTVPTAPTAPAPTVTPAVPVVPAAAVVPAVPVTPTVPSSNYTAPPDLAKTVAELPHNRQNPAKALIKAITAAFSSIHKQGALPLEEGSTIESKAQSFALQIERAVFDTHPATKVQKEYNQQIKTLNHNLKNNLELCNGLVVGSLSPTSLAVMSSEQLASTEMQRQTAEMKAKAEKQAILYTADTGPRIRRTHKGEEVIDDEVFNNSEAPPPLQAGARHPSQPVKNEPTGGDRVDLAHPTQTPDGGQHSPGNPNFDIGKVFSSVKSPTDTHHRRPSALTGPVSGPGVDHDVDRMLEDENESPPYSPTEDTQDPDVIWRGSLLMTSIADFPATAKYIGGANFGTIAPWNKLIPKHMNVAGRITQQSAVEYLCSLRYSSLTDIVVVNVTPVSPSAQPEFNALIDYFVSKNRYGVIGDKVVGNVRDTYLVPVPPGEDNYPEFMLNLADNKIPKSRTEAMLLAVFVYRNDPEQLQQLKGTPEQNAQASPSTPSGYAQHRSNSTAGPAFSPATPQGAFPPHSYNGHIPTQTPVPIPQPPHTRPPAAAAAAPAQPNQELVDETKRRAQLAGQAVAQEVLGHWLHVPTAKFLLPQAFQMSRREWEVIKGIYDREERAREDLQYLATLIEQN